MNTQQSDVIFCHGNIFLKNIAMHRPGQIIIFVFLEEGFPKDHSKAIHSSMLIPKKSSMIIPVKMPSRQEFAIKALHDEDMNGRVTKNWTGYLPKEGLGFSAGVTILRGIPIFRKAKIRFVENEMIEISMRYPGWLGI